MKFKFLASRLYFIILIFFVSFVLTSFQFRFLITSFKIHPAGYKIPLITLFPDAKTQSPLEKTTRINLEHGVIEETGHSLSFSLKTLNSSQKETLLFYSTDQYLSSNYWNISLIDGKIETARMEHFYPIITEKKINDGQWHQVFITTNDNEVKIYLDHQLIKNGPVSYLRTPDQWFVINVDSELTEKDQIQLKDFIFVNQKLSPKEFKIYQDFFLGNNFLLLGSFVFRFFFNLLSFFSLITLLFLLIKSKYPKETLTSIFNYLSPRFSLAFLAALAFWTGYGYQISLLCFLFFAHHLLQKYPNVFPPFLKIFVEVPLSFASKSLTLLRELKIKGLFLYFTSQKPAVYFYLLLLLGLLLSFNRFFFTNNLFR